MSVGLVRDFKLHERAALPAPVTGRTMTAAQFSAEITHGTRSPRWLIENAGGEIGRKPGRDWFFYESEAREWWAKYLEKGKGGR